MSLLRQCFPVVSVIIVIVMSVLDGTLVNVALPSLTKEFDVEPNTAIWLINSYQMVIMMFLLVFATLGDIIGYRKIFLYGVTVFTIASALCALSQNFEMLVCSRVLQGLGAACVMSVNTALVRLIYPPEVLGRGMSINAMAVAVSSAAGPSIAGLILSALSWHWLFAINIPLGIISFWIGYKRLPRNVSLKKKNVGFWGCLGNVLTFGLMIYALEGFAHHESRVLISVAFVAFLVIGYFYLRSQLNASTPLLPVDLLKIPIFARSIMTSVSSFMAQMLAMVSLPFFFQDAMHFTPVEIGVLLTPWPIATMLTAPIAGRLVERYHPGILGAIGMGIFSAGLFLLYFMPEGSDVADIFWRVMICGAGFGLFQTPNNLTIMSSAPMERSGGASGMLGMARLCGQTLGTTAVAIVFAIMPHTAGARLCLLFGAVVALIAGTASMSRVTQKFVNPRNRSRQ